MKLRVAVICLAGWLAWATPGWAQQYVFNGAPVGDVYPPVNCTTAQCPAYVANVSAATGRISVDSQIIQQTPPTDALSRVTGFRFDDSAIVYDSSDPQTQLRTFNVRTDATGTPQQITVNLTRWNTATPAADGSENARYSTLEISWRTSGEDYYITTNLLCTALAGTTPERCAASTSDDSTGSARWLSGVNPVSTFVFVPPQAVPTLSEWAILAMGLLLAAVSVVLLRRRDVSAR